jgi:hypothetical protein
MHLIPELLDDADQLTTEPAAHESSLFGDVPRPIWIAFLSAWGLLFGLFLLFFTADAPSTLAVVTASFFGLMTLGLPGALGAFSKSRSRGWPNGHDPQRATSDTCRRRPDPSYPVRRRDRPRVVRLAGPLEVPRRGNCPRS